MSTVVLDRESKVSLQNSTNSFEIHDASGKRLGVYLPEEEYNRMLYQLAEANCPYSKAELDKMRNEPGETTLAEIWRKLGVAS